jgi:hypothetical protein
LWSASRVRYRSSQRFRPTQPPPIVRPLADHDPGVLVRGRRRLHVCRRRRHRERQRRDFHHGLVVEPRDTHEATGDLRGALETRQVVAEESGERGENLRAVVQRTRGRTGPQQLLQQAEIGAVVRQHQGPEAPGPRPSRSLLVGPPRKTRSRRPELRFRRRNRPVLRPMGRRQAQVTVTPSRFVTNKNIIEG